MQPIADWLKKLGMSEYAQRFADNDIDASVLRELTDQDLKDLGISLSHRRRMLRAIRDLGEYIDRFAENRMDLRVLSHSFGRRTRPWLA